MCFLFTEKSKPKERGWLNSNDWSGGSDSSPSDLPSPTKDKQKKDSKAQGRLQSKFLSSFALAIFVN